jgi:hypothetical protein
MLQWTELNLSLNFFTDFIKPILEHGHIRNSHKNQTHSISEKLNVISKVGGVSNVPASKSL